MKGFSDCDSCTNIVKKIKDDKNNINFKIYRCSQSGVCPVVYITYFLNGQVVHKTLLKEYYDDWWKAFYTYKNDSLFLNKENINILRYTYKIEKEIDYDYIKVSYNDEKQIIIYNEKNNNTYEIFLLPEYYNSIGIKKWKIRKESIIDSKGIRYVKK